MTPRARLLAPVVPVAVVHVVGSLAASARHPGSSGPLLVQATGRPLDALAVLLLLVGPLALLARRRRPLVAQGVAALAVVVWSVVGYPQGPVWLALAAATVSAVVHSDDIHRDDGVPRRAVLYSVVALTWALAWLLIPAVRGELPPGQAVVATLAWLLVLVGVGEVVRARRAAAVDRRQRSEQAVLTEAEERRRRASDERLAVARELHDVIGHSLSMITVQSGVALELMDARPEVAREALTAIRAASRDALVEVHGVLASLRGGDDASRAPAPTVTDVDALVARARSAGLAVTTRIQGDLTSLPMAVDLAAARIVQEALTNVARHAGGAAAAVLLQRSATGLLVRIDDDGPPTAPARNDTSGGGSGLPGMRERATALGGRLAAGPRPSGGWRVETELPLAPAAGEGRP